MSGVIESGEELVSTGWLGSKYAIRVLYVLSLRAEKLCCC